MRKSWPLSIDEVPLGLARRSSPWSPSCESCLLAEVCALQHTTLSCDHSRLRGADDSLLPGTPGWRRAVARLHGLSIEVPIHTPDVGDLPAEIPRVKLDRRLSGFEHTLEAICVSTEHVWSRGHLRTKHQVLKACGLSSSPTTVLAVTGRDQHLNKVKLSFERFRLEVVDAGYDLVLGPGLSVWDGVLPSTNTVAVAQSARMTTTLASLGAPVVPAALFYQGFELMELAESLRESGPHPVVWIDLQTARVGRRWQGYLEELSILQGLVPELRFIAYGVHDPGRIASLRARLNVICTISAYDYARSAATAPGQLFAESFDSRRRQG